MLVGDTALFQGWNDVVVDVQVVPVRHDDRHRLLRQGIPIAVGIVGEDHLVGVPALAHSCHRVDSVLEREINIDPEPVHSDIGAVRDEFLEVVEIGGVARVADHHPGQVDAFFGEDALLLEPAPGARVRVRGDRHTGAAVRLRDGPQHPLDAGRHSRFVGGALEDRGLDPGVGDALLDVANEHVGHELGPVEYCARPAVVKVERYIVVGVQPSRHDDVQVGLGRDSGDPRNVATETYDREVDDGVDAAGLQFVQPGNRIGDAFGLVTPGFGIVLQDLGGHDEHVLVHQRHA